MAEEKIEKLDLTKVAPNKPQEVSGPKVEQAGEDEKPEDQKQVPPSVSLRDVPLPKKQL